jgi:predicted NUDIX family NTP pyrophosphohydrolase
MLDGMARKTEVSAGLLVYRRRDARGCEVLLAHPGGPFWARKDVGAWTIPKGLVEGGADLIATALREFTEETGFVAQGPFVPLQPVRQKSGKTVHAFACAGDFDPAALKSNTFEIEWPPRSGRHKRFPEVDRVAWLAPAAAREKILSYQLPFLDGLDALLAS